MTLSVQSTSPEQTAKIAKRFARSLKSGDVVLLVGEVGAGKTTFVQAVCASLGVQEAVTSPTFTLAQRYQAQGVEISHLDLYRLSGANDIMLEGLDEELAPGRIVFIEWPEFGKALFEDQVSVVVKLEHLGHDRRRISITPSNEDSRS